VRKFLAAATVVPLLVSLISAPPASAWEPVETATFNVPAPWGTAPQKNAIIRKVEQAINRTPAGQTILIATYLLDRRSSVDALIDACKRGVSVRVILDGQIVSGSSKRLVSALNGDNIRRTSDGWTQPRTRRCGRPFATNARTAPLSDLELARSVADPSAASPTWGKDQSYVKKCDGSCRGNGANMHAKFYAFSRTGTAANVVIISSSNLNDGGAGRGWNDMYTFKRRPKSFALYQKLHREMTQDDEGDDGGKVQLVDGRYTTRIFPWTGISRREDPVIRDLNKVGCHGANGRTRVHVSMFFWKGKRGNFIATKLLDLARQRCEVSIIFGAPSRQIADRLRKAARAGLISLYDSRWWIDEDEEVDVRTHSKYVLVNGRYGGDPQSWQVMTSTANWVPGSLRRCDENSLNIRSASAWRAYKANWDTVKAHSRRIPGGAVAIPPPTITPRTVDGTALRAFA
jgi:phosphatidylserine/phosphatidylglycerophosphate/cardiolipin synthase-like enzyme